MRNEQRGSSRGSGRYPGTVPEAGDAADWFAGRLPSDWFVGEAEVTVDREEIIVLGELALGDATAEAGDTTEDGRQEPTAARGQGRAARFREDTRAERMRIAEQAQDRYGRTVSWGVRVAGQRIMFTQATVPVMTRLR
ncbi:MAG: hypothetical protein ACRDRL_24770, partial [Sciscionella sp.]